jgi:hypothetical protein
MFGMPFADDAINAFNKLPLVNMLLSNQLRSKRETL